MSIKYWTIIAMTSSLLAGTAHHCYFWQESTICWFSEHGRELLSELQTNIHWEMDVTCNNPEECKCQLDWFFKVLHVILDVHDIVMNFLWNPTSCLTSPLDVKIAKKHKKDKMYTAMYNYSVKGNGTRAKNVLKSLRFSSYEENNQCDLKEGIPKVEFDATVEEIADLTNLPKKIKAVVKRAKTFRTGNRLAVNKVQFRTKTGNMVFGRIAVLRNGDTLDMAYSLHSVKYELQKKQSKPENAGNFTKFSETIYKANDINDQGDEDDDDSNEISFDLRQDFVAFFHTQAIEGFEKHCDYMLKFLDNTQKEEPESVKHTGVKSDGVK